MKSVCKSPRFSLARPPQYPLRTCLWTQTRRRWDISLAKFIKPSGRGHPGRHAFSIWGPGAEARQLPAAVSDTCGRNVGRGRRRARAELQHGFSLKPRRASGLRPQTQRAQTVVSAAQLSLPLAPSSDRLLRSVFSCLFPPRRFRCRWLWTAAGACGDPGGAAPGRAGEGWSSPTGSAPTPSLGTEASTARVSGFSTGPATRRPAPTTAVSGCPTNASPLDAPLVADAGVRKR